MLLRNIAVTCLPNDDSLKDAGIVYMRKRGGWFGRACSPAPAASHGNVHFKGVSGFLLVGRVGVGWQDTP
ncbi:hypothetical protein FJU31_08865 [Stenotrophomonas cyclobalanopsidis]|uniref:Uncharacterized protein n=1 Tax=Stenotrophomonas cyclobalanopsidis TaxID=2771362 RepID=A0ABQ6T1P9_9GAMM|nr:hypothetical protein [Stenotrophomonas cyclobalanopsidis]KAA8999616.1 hypothetical protein FJU31_08865 [Stenotrophomonas cyclobalanopsidis]